MAAPAAVRLWSGVALGVSLGALAACAKVPVEQGSVADETPRANSAPTLSGQPPSTVAAGSAYVFAPVARDADGDLLSFSITGKPDWAEFSIATGRLSGEPPTGSRGVHAGIQITASDGRATTALPLFSITVLDAVAGSSGTGVAHLRWTAPVQNTDGSALTNLAGFRIYQGPGAGLLTLRRQIADPRAVGETVAGLESGTHYFALSAYSTTGAESELSQIRSKTIP